MQRLPHNRSAVMLLEPPRVDGRCLRSERTRLAIIEAYLDLLRGDPRMPTAAQIARQAGGSVRSIFERFSDLDALSLATADYAIAQGQVEAVARSVDGDRPTRIQSHVETRARACEKWGPQWRTITNLSYESWDQIRHWYDLSMEAAQGVWRSAIDRICRRLDNRRLSTNWKTS